MSALFELGLDTQTIPSGSSSALQLCPRCRRGAPRSSSAAARSRSRFRCSASISSSTSSSSRRSSSSSRPFGNRSRVAATDEQAREELWPQFLEQRTRIGGERGWPPPTRAQFEREAGPHGALFVGSPTTVAAKIAATARTLELSRFDLKYANGAMPHAQLLSSIRLIGTAVLPRVHELLGR